jgi:DNA-binding response OmpR family regulator
MSRTDNTKPVLLVVDDEPEIREIIAFCAQDIGFQVLEAGDGAQALEVVRSHHVDIVCSDLMMPRVSGITLLSHMRDEGRSQPFILLTSYPSQDSTIQALRLGAFDYLEKPFETEELKKLLNEALRVSREVSNIAAQGPDSGETFNPLAKDNFTEALQVITRLKALRYNNPSAVDNPQEDRKKVVELFISEAVPQLVFCDGAIKNLESEVNRAFELGYLFRVMQTIASAASAINEDSVAQFAKKAEHFYTALRVKPRSVRDDYIALAAEANDVLRQAISAIGAETLPDRFEEIGGTLEKEAAILSGAVAPSAA